MPTFFSELASMSPDEQEAQLQTMRAMHPGSTQTMRERMLGFKAICGGGAGDPKSALFARLFNGKPALPYPPPAAGSYPWYAVIEEPGPFKVWVGEVQSRDALLGKTPYALDRGLIAINQCSWETVQANDAGGRLLELQERLAASAEPEEEGPRLWCNASPGASSNSSVARLQRINRNRNQVREPR